MVNFFKKVAGRVTAFLGIDWIREAREITATTQRPNIYEEHLRRQRMEDQQ